jgi:hypothetical protein
MFVQGDVIKRIEPMGLSSSSGQDRPGRSTIAEYYLAEWQKKAGEKRENPVIGFLLDALYPSGAGCLRFVFRIHVGLRKNTMVINNPCWREA